MKQVLVIALLINAVFVNAQTESQKLATVIQQFHEALIRNDTGLIRKQTDSELSYGHSNGWIETQEDMIKNLGTGYLQYHRFTADSMNAVVDKHVAYTRFIADITVTLNGNKATYHLKVLEVWVKRGKRWLLFARQAVRG